jgi:hypothetical protein
MAVKDDIKSVLRELSPILAGFKLAVIIIGYFGLGSVAKWVISYWYPFTRWVWDRVADLFFLPEFPVIIKDSLTALLFFLPLGVTAIWQWFSGKTDSKDSHRVMGAVFGILILIVICKDVVSSIISSISTSMQDPLVSSLLTSFSKFGYSDVMRIGFGFGIAIAFSLAILFLDSRRIENTFLVKLKSFFDGLQSFIKRSRKTIIISYAVFTPIGLTTVFYELISKSDPSYAIAVVVSIGILFLILLSLLLAILYAPKKLYVTTGAGIAFVLAAAFFEAFIVAKSFMESV